MQLQSELPTKDDHAPIFHCGQERLLHGHAYTARGESCYQEQGEVEQIVEGVDTATTAETGEGVQGSISQIAAMMPGTNPM